jgi:hypothetical protein
MTSVLSTAAVVPSATPSSSNIICFTLDDCSMARLLDLRGVSLGSCMTSVALLSLLLTALDGSNLRATGMISVCCSASGSLVILIP